MPALLLIGIPVAVVVLFMGIMSLPDEKNNLDSKSSTPVKEASVKKKKK
jgi:hypothetical protein